MNVAELRRSIVPALLSGTRRADLGVEKLGVEGLRADAPKALLKALCFCGQALRFERAEAPDHFALETWPKDERPIVPSALRSLMVRLLSGGKCSEDSMLALARALDRHKLRPHPFDLPRMDGFVKSYAERLGTTAQYWAQREAPPERQRGYFDADELNEQNWTQAPPARRARFLDELRGRDAATARGLLESVWAQEPVDARLRLLAVMQTGLSVDDRPFLEGLSKDRAPRVKSLAQSLLARLPGEQGENPALKACLGRIQKSQGGLLKKRLVLKLELPATIKEHNASRWIQEQFADVSLAELADGLGSAEADLVAAAEKDEHLLFALALMATRALRFDLLAKIVGGPLPEAWGRMSQCASDDMEFTRDEDRERWAEVVVRPAKWMPEGDFSAWNWLHKRMEGPLPAQLMKEILNSKAWTDQLKSEHPPAAAQVQAFCALCAAEMRGRLREQIEPLEMERKEKGLELLEILERLESVAQ